MIYKNKNINGNIFNIINGLLTIIDGLIKILSLGYCRGDYSYQHIKNKLK